MPDSRTPARRLPDSHGQFLQGRTSVILHLVAVVGLASLWACAHIADQAATVRRCPSSVQARVSAVKPTVRVSYTEPTLDQAAGPLKDLAKTTIYYDVGNGRVPIKEVPASKPTGGGKISEIISVPVRGDQETVVRICVTATNQRGDESRTTP